MKSILLVMVAIAVAAAGAIYQRSRISDLKATITGLETENRSLERLQPKNAGIGTAHPGAAAAIDAAQAGDDASLPVELGAEEKVAGLLDKMGELIWQVEESGDRQSMENEGKALMIELMTLSGAEALKAIENVAQRDWPDEMKMDLPSREGQMMLVMLAQQWAQNDPEKAAKYFEGLAAEGKNEILGDQLMQSIEGSIALAFVKKDLPRAFEYVAKIEDSRTRSQVMQALSSEMKTVGQWKKYLEVAKGIDDTKLQSTAVLGLAATLSRQPFEPEVVDAFRIPETMKAEFARKFAMGHIDPQTAERANWAMENTEMEVDRRNLITQLVNRWTWKDFNGAAEWLGSLPDSRVRDDGVRVFSQLIAKKEPESAVDWARTISDPKLRDKTLNDVYEKAEKESPGKAAAYFAELGLEVPEPVPDS